MRGPFNGETSSPLRGFRSTRTHQKITNNTKPISKTADAKSSATKFLPPAQSAQYCQEFPVLPIKNSRAKAYQERPSVTAGFSPHWSHNLVMLPSHPIDGLSKLGN